MEKRKQVKKIKKMPIIKQILKIRHTLLKRHYAKYIKKAYQSSVSKEKQTIENYLSFYYGIHLNRCFYLDDKKRTIAWKETKSSDKMHDFILNSEFKKSIGMKSKTKIDKLRHFFSMGARELYHKGYQKSFGPIKLGVDNIEINCKSDSVIESNLYLYGFYDEIIILRIYQSILLKGDIAIDIGANIGIHSLVMAKAVGMEGRVYAFEPRKDILERLEKNIALNNAKNVIVKSYGLWEKFGYIGFDARQNEFNQMVARVDEKATEKIKVSTLDVDFMNETFIKSVSQRNITKIKIIKIDVEGGEVKVLQGAQKLLSHYKPYIIFEYNDPPWTLNDFLDLIPYSFILYRIPNTYHEIFTKINKSSILNGYNNLLLVPVNSETS